MLHRPGYRYHIHERTTAMDKAKLMAAGCPESHADKLAASGLGWDTITKLIAWYTKNKDLIQQDYVAVQELIAIFNTGAANP